jgi:hypothetical protein
MIDLYRLGATARQVAGKFGVSLRSVKRLLHRHGVRRESRATHKSQAGCYRVASVWGSNIRVSGLSCRFVASGSVMRCGDTRW